MPMPIERAEVAAVLRGLAERVEAGHVGGPGLGSVLELTEVLVNTDRNLTDPSHAERAAPCRGYQVRIVVGWGEPAEGWAW